MTADTPTGLPDYGGLLDWRDADHWSYDARPCRWCTRPTNLRDSRRKPAHKTCTETALAVQAAEQAQAHPLTTTRKDT